MFKYLDRIIDEFPELITGKAATLEADHLFSVRDADEAKYLPEENALLSFPQSSSSGFLTLVVKKDTAVCMSLLACEIRNSN